MVVKRSDAGADGIARRWNANRGRYEVVPLQAPAHDRQRRVAWLLDVKDALLAGKVASPDAARFLGEALRDWLDHGGRLEDRLGTTGERGSHTTVAALAKRFSSALKPAERPHRDDDAPNEIR